MISILNRLRQIHWYQWLLSALAITYLLYITISYLYLPGKLKQVMETDVSNLIGRDITVERFDFNPFVLSLTVSKLSIADQPEKPLVSWQQLFVNFSLWKSFFKWEFALDDFSIDRPEINIEKHGNHFNFSEIFEHVKAKSRPEKAPKATPSKSTFVALRIAHCAINQGIFRFTDHSGSTVARSNLGDITIEVQDLYLATGDQHLNPFDLKATIPDGGEVTLKGRYRIDPLHIDANVVFNHVKISSYSEFVENVLPLKILDGFLSLSTTISVTRDTDFQLRLDQGQVRVTDLQIGDSVANPVLLRANAIMAEDVAFDLLNKKVTVESVSCDSIITHQWRDPTGRFRYEYLIPDQRRAHGPETQKTPSETSQTHLPWSILIKRIGVHNSAVNFSDQNKNITTDHDLSGLTLALENVTLTSKAPVTVQLSAVLDKKGQIDANGTLTLTPFSMDLNYRLTAIHLPPFSEYLDTTTFLKMENGILSTDGTLSLVGDSGNTFTAKLDLTLDEVKIRDSRNDTEILSLPTFNLNDFQINTTDQKVGITSINLTAPELFISMSREKKMNLTALSRPRDPGPQSAGTDKTKGANESAGWGVTIEKIALKGGTVHYLDESVAPAFKTALHDVTLTADQISTNSEASIPFLLTSKIDRYAPFTIKGNLQPFDQQPAFNFSSHLDGIEMHGLSPYSATFIGNQLKSGKLSLALDYSLRNRKLTGKNKIVAKNLYLGDKTPGDPAIKAPVALGLALLRDTKGVIDLNVDVSGDLDDPGFSVSGIVIKALVNVFAKAASSPFKLLGSLVGSREDIGKIVFAEGLAALSQDNEARLKQLAEALVQRPQLSLRIKGNASKQDDGPKLLSLEVCKLVADARKISLTELQTAAGEGSWWMTSDNRDALVKINDDLNLPTVSERTTRLQAAKPELKGDGLMAEVYRQLYNDVTEAQKITSEMLLSLADHRALAIQQYLVNSLQLDHQRVSVTKTQETDLTGRSINLEIEPL